LIMLISLSLLSLTCKDAGVQPPDKTFSLTVADASCTEVYLNLKIGTGITSRKVTLKRDTITLFTKTIDAAETIITDTNLTPNHSYTYTAQLLNGSTAVNSTAQTMDTTSHAFSWQTFTLGDGSGSSTLYDVVIVNDTLAYAVGAIYQGGSVYNLAKWNGQTWQLLQIQFLDFCGQSSTYSYPTSAVWVFNENDIWIASGSEIVQWNGQVQTTPVCIPISVNKLWAENTASIYAVGNGGGIAHYNGSSWTKIESGTDLQFLDIYGATNPKSGEQQILSVCTQNFPGDRGIFEIKGNTATRISSDPIGYELFGVWFVPNREYFVLGSGIYEKHLLSDVRWMNGPRDITGYGVTKMRGNGINDVFIVGSFGECLHFNGATWKSFRDVTSLGNGGFACVAMKGNLVVAVGENNASAVLSIGRR